jgi:hypothetical protein
MELTRHLRPMRGGTSHGATVARCRRGSSDHVRAAERQRRRIDRGVRSSSTVRSDPSAPASTTPGLPTDATSRARRWRTGSAVCQKRLRPRSRLCAPMRALAGPRPEAELITVRCPPCIVPVRRNANIMTLWPLLPTFFRVSTAPLVPAWLPLGSPPTRLHVSLVGGSGLSAQHSTSEHSGTPAGFESPQNAGAREGTPVPARRGSATPDPRFTHLSPANGLSHSDVRAVAPDRQAFLWIGTWLGGLSCYDGCDFKVHRHDPREERSLGSDSVWALYIDHAGVLWVALCGGGLDQYDRETDSCVPFQHREGDPTSLPSDSVDAIHEDEADTPWISTEHGLDRFDARTRAFARRLHDPRNPDSPSDDHVPQTHEDREGRF